MCTSLFHYNYAERTLNVARSDGNIFSTVKKGAHIVTHGRLAIFSRTGSSVTIKQICASFGKRRNQYKLSNVFLFFSPDPLLFKTWSFFKSKCRHELIVACLNVRI